jgi:hypothetical protein
VFRKLIDRVKTKLSRAAMSYAERAAVIVPFILALGFTIAAVHAMSVEHFGSVTGNWIMAGGLAGLGVIGAIVVRSAETSGSFAPAVSDPAGSLSKHSLGILHVAPVALHLLSSMRQPSAQSARLAWRHAPLLAFAGLMSLMFWPTPPAHGAGSPVADTPDEERLAAASQGSLTMQYAVRTLLADQTL